MIWHCQLRAKLARWNWYGYAELMPNRVQPSWNVEPVGSNWRELDGLHVPARFRYSETLPGGYLVTLEIALTDGAPDCRSIEISSNGGTVPATVLRQIDLRRMRREAFQRAASLEATPPSAEGELQEVWPAVLNWDKVPEVTSWQPDQPSRLFVPLGEVLPSSSRTRGSQIPVDLAQVAASYRNAHQLGQPPAIAVAHKFSVSRTTASRWIRRCRDQGLLGKAKPGSAGEFGQKRSRRR
jgi:hypothetical protein